MSFYVFMKNPTFFMENRERFHGKTDIEQFWQFYLCKSDFQNLKIDIIKLKTQNIAEKRLILCAQ